MATTPGAKPPEANLVLRIASGSFWKSANAYLGQLDEATQVVPIQEHLLAGQKSSWLAARPGRGIVNNRRQGLSDPIF